MQEGAPRGAATAPEVLTVPLLAHPALIHGFTTRNGGVSQGPFASLSFSPKWEEDREAVVENHKRLARHLGYDGARLYRVFQVHGAEGVVVQDEDPAEVYRHHADFLVTDRPGATLGVITADCVPVLLLDPARPAVAAVHAGWRGLVAGVIQAAVRALGAAYGSPPAVLRAALGPSIGPCCFEVGPEVVAEFEAAFPDAPELVIPAGTGAALGARPHVDLWQGARRALEGAGVAPASIADPAGCTCCAPARFHSYRRQGPKVGQQISVIGIRG